MSQDGWMWQGRQGHGWFGHGTRPRDGSPPGGGRDGGPVPATLEERIRAVGSMSVAGLPASKRHHPAAGHTGAALDRLVGAMRAWAGAGHLDDASFAAHFFGRHPSSPVVGHLRRAAELVRIAATSADIREATGELAAGMVAVGLDGWPRFLVDAHTRATAAWAVPERRSQPLLVPVRTGGSSERDAATSVSNRGGTIRSQDLETVNGPGSARNRFGMPLDAAPRQSTGVVPGAANLDWSVDRDVGTLNFYRRDPNGGRTQLRSLQLRGDQVLAPNGQSVGRLRADGGFDMDRAYLNDLRMCALPGFGQTAPLPQQPGTGQAPPLPPLPGTSQTSPLPSPPGTSQGAVQGPQILESRSDPGLTRPTGDLSGVPSGPRSTGRLRSANEERTAAAEKAQVDSENRVADALAGAGYRTVQNPTRGPNPPLTPERMRAEGLNPRRNPDLLVEDRVFDTYTPKTNELRGIRDGIKEKIDEGQPHRVVVDLSNTTEAAVRAALRAEPVHGLKEIIIYTEGGLGRPFRP